MLNPVPKGTGGEWWLVQVTTASTNSLNADGIGASLRRPWLGQQPVAVTVTDPAVPCSGTSAVAHEAASTAWPDGVRHDRHPLWPRLKPLLRV